MGDFYRGDYSKKVITVLSMMTATGAKNNNESVSVPTRDWSYAPDIISRCKPLCETLFNLDLNPFQFPLAIGILWSTIKRSKTHLFLIILTPQSLFDDEWPCQMISFVLVCFDGWFAWSHVFVVRRLKMRNLTVIQQS